MTQLGNLAPSSAARTAAFATGSIAEFGFVNPVLVGDHGVIVAGHGRVMAARKLGLAEAPVIVLSHLTPTQWRALMIADNKSRPTQVGTTRCCRPSWQRSGMGTSTSACSTVNLERARPRRLEVGCRGLFHAALGSGGLGRSTITKNMVS
jgi:hypothetical protein